MPKIIQIIGSGFSSLAAACYLAKAGNTVSVFEKNSSLGGRARQFNEKGFTFDMGPSWYWMPDVFESFFSQFNKKPSDYYELMRLDPSYRIFNSKENNVDIPAGSPALFHLFEKIEPDISEQLKKLLKKAKYKYEV